jgi:citronellyl-CoA synthetase
MTRTLVRAARQEKFKPQDRRSIGALLTRNARIRGDRPALTADGETISWAEFERRANRVADALATRHGVRHGDAVALMMENRLAFLTVLFGICKLGAVAGLLNTNQRRDVLVHSAKTIDAKLFVVGAELTDAVDEVRGELALEAGRDYVWVADPALPDAARPAWAVALDDRDTTLSDAERPETAEVTLDDPCFFIFTSGTTGLPKAAIVSNERVFRGMQGFGAVTLDAQPSDRLYNCLPLYHSTALIVGFGSILWAGGSMYMRRKFSASNFLREVREEQTNVFVYIGEICRYLLHAEQAPDAARNPLFKVIGNGLRPDIWDDFKYRFGIDKVFEIYGASEGNSGFVNAFNKDRTIGFSIATVALLRYDTDEDALVRGADGLCEEVPKGEPGLLLIEIAADARFDGYTDKNASEKKIVRDVLKKGDAWFNTGDLVRQVDVGFAFGQKHYQFVDRTGDTFRWKGENCSTNEVGEIINAFPQVHTTNVYGVQVPGADGRAGMAAITFDPDQVKSAEDVDWAGLSAHVRDKLASYARPVFVRVSAHDQDTTSTFKLLKKELREEAFHLDRVGDDAIYVMKPGKDVYEPLDAEFHDAIMAGKAGY